MKQNALFDSGSKIVKAAVAAIQDDIGCDGKGVYDIEKDDIVDGAAGNLCADAAEIAERDNQKKRDALAPGGA